MSLIYQNIGHYGTSQHIIPTTAIEVHVHNILSPYCILVSNVKECTSAVEVINEKLRALAKQKCHSTKDKTQLKDGTMVIIHPETLDGVDLPAWYSRGIIVRYNEETSKYITFLPDHGHHMELPWDSLIRVPHDSINEPFLTYAVGMYEILPSKKMKSSRKRKVEIIIDKDWTMQSIDLTMQLICSSTKSYFDHVTTLKNNIKCGELYLIIDNQNVPLQQALIRAHCAVYLAYDLLNNRISNDQSVTSTTTDNTACSDELLSCYDSKCSEMRNAKRNIYHEILISSNVECRRLNDIAEARFDSSVLKAIKKLSISHLRRLQSYIWPAINKGLDVLAVGPPKCGKTVGYVTPISSIIVNTKQYQVENHPMSLILCSSSNQVLYIQSIFIELLSSYEIKIIGAFNGCSDRSLMAGIISGCHIFISTPAFLVRFLERNEYHRKELKFTHISHLVIDDLDVLLERHCTALTQLLGRYTLVGKKSFQHTNMLALQLVAAAQQWSPVIGKFTQIFTNPYICIGSFADAAIFCGIRLRPRLVIKDQKKFKITELLSDIYRKVKTIIVCANNREADELNEYLSSNFNVLYVHNQMLFTELIGIRELWESSVSGAYQVMICPDEVLPNLKITDVNWLIHYSIAVSSKSLFLFRFSTLMTNLRKKSRNVEVTIFIDDTNDLQFRGIMDMVKRSGVAISPELLNAIEKTSVTIEREKKCYPICNNIKLFGYCSKIGRCNYRHCVLPEVDAPMMPLTIGNNIRFVITYVHSATHFSARIIVYTDDNNEQHEISDVEHIQITTKVLYHYSNKNNRYRSKEIAVGGIYAYDDSFDTYKRVQVIDVVCRDKDDLPHYVNLRCIDSGILYSRVRTSKLMEMPKELADEPAHIVEIFLANLLPYDDESEWNARANKCTHQWFSDQLQTRRSFLQGKVCLHLGNTVWVNCVEVRTKITGRRVRELVSGSLSSHLIEQKHGIINREHLISLKRLCSNAGMLDKEELDD